MILIVSGRCDIVAFHTEWFMNRLKEGFVCVRNPFNPKLVSKINFSDVELILFCTKNPIPIVDKIDKINKKMIFHVTITPYKKDIEPNVVDKKEIILAVKKISDIIGSSNVVVRYDPIFINKRYNIDYHIRAFSKLCSELDGYIDKIIVSFLDDYKNVRNNKEIINEKKLTEEDYKLIGQNFSKIAREHNMTVQTCFEERNLVEYGFIKGECLPMELAYNLTGKKYSKWKARNCNCANMVDIGVYNSCKHFCKYCYANYDENKVVSNSRLHDKNSPLLIGNIESDDVIKVRVK